MSEKKQTEDESASEKSLKAIARLDEQIKANQKMIEKINLNREKLNKWKNIERYIATRSTTDEQALKYLNDSFGEGMLVAVLNKYIPEIKKSFMDAIDKDYELTKEK